MLIGQLVTATGAVRLCTDPDLRSGPYGDPMFLDMDSRAIVRPLHRHQDCADRPDGSILTAVHGADLLTHTEPFGAGGLHRALVWCNACATDPDRAEFTWQAVAGLIGQLTIVDQCVADLEKTAGPDLTWEGVDDGDLLEVTVHKILDLMPYAGTPLPGPDRAALTGGHLTASLTSTQGAVATWAAPSAADAAAAVAWAQPRLVALLDRWAALLRSFPRHRLTDPLTARHLAGPGGALVLFHRDEVENAARQNPEIDEVCGYASVLLTLTPLAVDATSNAVVFVNDGEVLALRSFGKSMGMLASVRCPAPVTPEAAATLLRMVTATPGPAGHARIRDKLAAALAATS